MTKRRYKGQGKVEFLANMDRIRSELQQGWPIRAIYDRLSEEGMIHCGYDQMLKYVRELIRGRPGEKTSAQKTAAQTENEVEKQQEGPVKVTSDVKKFKHDPTPKPDKLY